MQLELSGLAPDNLYDLFLDDGAGKPGGTIQPLTAVKTDAQGKATGQALGIFRRSITGGARLVVATVGPTGTTPVLTQEVKS